MCEFHRANFKCVFFFYQHIYDNILNESVEAHDNVLNVFQSCIIKISDFITYFSFSRMHNFLKIPMF